jgi:hypothetical protein
MTTRSKLENKDISISEPQSVCSFLDSLGIDPAELELIAIETGWQKQIPKKITSSKLIAALCEESVDGTPSYSKIASAIDAASGQSPTKQAVEERMNKACKEMIRTVLQLAIARRITTVASGNDSGLFSSYDRVLVQDSTIIKLPAWLYDEFSGVSNGSSKVCNARIQAVYDLKSMSFVKFSIDSYSKNDLKAAPELEIREGDLVLRDRGYLTMDEIKRHMVIGADFIYRHKTGTIYLDPDTGEEIDLAETLRQKKGRLDCEVTLNDESRTRVRLVAAPVDQATAEKRRRKAKKETKGHNPSRAVLELMDWTIFITNMGKEVGFTQLLDIYGLRWRIEVIFKAWKSNLNFHVIHRVSELELRICLTASLIMITVGIGHLYQLCHAEMFALTGRDLSLLKFSQYISKHPARMTRICDWLTAGAQGDDPICQSLRKYCCYDKRKRENYQQKLRRINTP